MNSGNAHCQPARRRRLRGGLRRVGGSRLVRLVSLAAGLWMACTSLGGGAERPHILFLLADDLRPDAIAALGQSDVRTPHLDALVRRGQSFEAAYAANPVCVASRAEILTGCTSLTNGIFPGFSMRLAPGLVTWPQALQRVGYRTCFIGKWHLPERPSEQGYASAEALFAEYATPLRQAYECDAYGRPITGYRNWAFQDDAGNLLDPAEPAGLTPDINGRFADAAIREIRRSRGSEPFFIHVNFTAPHDPLLWPPGRVDERDSAQIALPKNFLPSHPFDNGFLVNRDEALLPPPRAALDVQKELAIYYALVEEIDRQTGRILAALDASGQREQTLVIFSSDHGLAKGSHGLLGKQNFYEHTATVPLILDGPKLRGGVRRSALVQLLDLFPTICELVGAEIPTSVEGRSFAPVLRDESETSRREIFGYFYRTQRMLRTPQYKLITYPATGRRQLFDVAKDPYELHDLSTERDYAEQLATMEQRLQELQAVHKDPLLVESSRQDEP